jgi:hypothetical protein
MMIKKNLLFCLLLSAIIVGGVSCLNKTENRSSAFSIAVIDSNANMGGCVMNLPNNVVLAAPELASKLKTGDCIQANFSIDYSNQPSTRYLTATEISYQLLNNKPAEIASGEMIDAYQDSIHSIALSISPNYNGNVFVEISRTEINNYVYDYKLILNSDSIDENGIPSVFLKSKKLPNASGSQTNVNLETFNLQSLIEGTYGKDSTYKEGSIEQDYRYISLNFKYQSGLKDNVPVYSNLTGNKPVDILIFK